MPYRPVAIHGHARASGVEVRRVVAARSRRAGWRRAPHHMDVTARSSGSDASTLTQTRLVPPPNAFRSGGRRCRGRTWRSRGLRTRRSGAGDWRRWRRPSIRSILVRTELVAGAVRLRPRGGDGLLQERVGVAWTGRLRDEIVDLGDRVIVVSLDVSGQHSGASGELRWTEINTYREGRAILCEFFIEHAQALKAVGLEE